MSTLTDSNPTALDLLYKSVITQRRMTELCIKHKKEVGKELRCGCDCAESPPPPVPHIALPLPGICHQLLNNSVGA